jgi:hypothetical protein
MTITQKVMRGCQSCPATRLRVDDWKGVRARGDTASAVLRGAYETSWSDDWEPRRHEWRAVLRPVGGDWKIAALDADNLDYRD